MHQTGVSRCGLRRQAGIAGAERIPAICPVHSDSRYRKLVAVTDRAFLSVGFSLDLRTHGQFQVRIDRGYAL
jgi:hypothetical protein